MARSSGSLLAQIEAGVLADEPLAGLLRKCVVLGGHAGSEALREWASRELQGYLEGEVPSYRLVPAPLRVDAMSGRFWVKGQAISPEEFPSIIREQVKEEVPLRAGVAELHALAEQTEAAGRPARIEVPMARQAGQLIDEGSGNPFQQTHSIYWIVGAPTILGVLDHVRTKLAELVAELRAASSSTAGSATRSRCRLPRRVTRL